MAEAEELIGDAARHATVFVQDLWRKYRPPEERPGTRLTDVVRRLDLFLSAVFNTSWKIRPAQPPAPPSLLGIIMRNDRRPRLQQAVPATDGISIWLPPRLEIQDQHLAVQLYRTMAASQAQRAQRGSAAWIAELSPLERDVYLLLETAAAEQDLLENLPGLRPALEHLRHWSLARRPEIGAFPAPRRPLERFLRKLLQGEKLPFALTATASQSVEQARWLIKWLQLLPEGCRQSQLGPNPLLMDLWTGRFSAAEKNSVTASAAGVDQALSDDTGDSPRSSRLRRRPEVRSPLPDEDDENPDTPWMVQLDEPHPHAEDPMGMQRPTDRDEEDSADQVADMVSDLPEARLVTSTGRPKEVLLTDDPPDSRRQINLSEVNLVGQQLRYPEWDYRSQSYAHSACVNIRPPVPGSRQWVDETLAAHAGKLAMIRRRFQLLRTRPQWLRRQADGDEIDLEAYIESYSSFRAGGSLDSNLYQIRRRSRLNLAISLLIDISGSTDGWIRENRRVIDVEREALLLVCIALESLGEAYAVQAFSGEGREGVSIRHIKDFDERYSSDIGRRISALEPEHYTRAGAAIRHATNGLMKQPAGHRLLLLLSDGKPNDNDLYEGRYGLEDTRQAINEARQHGVHPFCLTIDQKGADYLPKVFGRQQYALLSRPDELPQVLLEWLRWLIASA